MHQALHSPDALLILLQPLLLVFYLLIQPLESEVPYKPEFDFHVFPFGGFNAFPLVSMVSIYVHIRLRGNMCEMQQRKQWKYMETCENIWKREEIDFNRFPFSRKPQDRRRKPHVRTGKYVEIKRKHVETRGQCNSGNLGKSPEIDFQYFLGFPRM